MRKTSVNSITYGAMFCALIGVLVYANKILAGAFDLYFFWIVPIPVIIYIVKFGVSQALVMCAAMLLMTAIISGPISASTFYVVGAGVAGLVYGDGLMKGKSSVNLIARLITVSLVMLVFSTFVAASFFGYDLVEEIKLMGDMIKSVSDKYPTLLNANAVSQIVNSNKLFSIVVISYVLSSVLEGILVHLFAFLALKRFKLPTPPMKMASDIYAPAWLKIFVFAALLAGVMTGITGVTDYDNIVFPISTIASICCYFFGYIGIITYLAITIPDKKRRTALSLLLIVLSFIVPFIFIGIGLLDIFTDSRKKMIERVKNYAEQQNR